MITDAVVGWAAAFVSWLGGLIVLPTVPTFFGDLAGYVTTAASYVYGTGAWMPWTVMVTVIGVWATCLVVALTVKVVRIVASFLTLGGGSAA